jgi:very-short-patch-repair endonuclease
MRPGRAPVKGQRWLAQARSAATKRASGSLARRGLAGAAATDPAPRRIELYFVMVMFVLPKVVVEVDGAWHGQRTAADRRRDRVLGAFGYCVVRVSAGEVSSELEAVLARIRWAVAAVG